MLKEILAGGLYKRLFKLTDNYSWLRKTAGADSEPDLVVNLPTVEDFLGSLTLEGLAKTSSESDPKQAALNQAVAAGLIDFYKSNLDLSQTAFTSWKFADVSSSLIKGLKFFDVEDLAVVKASALKVTDDSEISAIISDGDKLSDAIKYVLTRGYLHSYTIMVAQNPAVAVLNLMQVINNQDLPLSMNVSQNESGSIVATAAPKKSKEEKDADLKFKPDSTKGPRLSDWIRSLKISRASILDLLQKEVSKAQPRDIAISTFKVQHLILSSHISHLENVASAWKELVKKDQFKSSKLGSVFIMDDPPIGNLLSHDVSSLSDLGGFLPPNIYGTYGLGRALSVKKWDGTTFSKIDTSDSFSGFDTLKEEVSAPLETLQLFMQKMIEQLPDSKEVSNSKQRLTKYLQSTKVLINSIDSLSSDAENSKTRSKITLLVKEFKDDVLSASVILHDLSKMHGFDIDTKWVSDLSKEIVDLLPRGAEDRLLFSPPAAFIKHVYLPSVTTKESFHNDLFVSAIGDLKESLKFGAGSRPKFTPQQRMQIISAFGLSAAQAEELARNIYREGFARALVTIEGIPDEALQNITDEKINAITTMYKNNMDTLKTSLFSTMSDQMPNATAEAFDRVCSVIWESLPQLAGQNESSSLSGVIKQIGGSAIAARTGGGGAQDFNDIYSTMFIKRQKQDATSAPGSGMAAVDRLTNDYFYEAYSDHEKKHDAWKDSYADVGASEEAQEVRRGIIKEHYDKVLKSDVLKKLGIDLPRGGTLVNFQNPVNPKNDEQRLNFLRSIQKFLNENRTIDILHSRVDQLDESASMEAVLVYLGIEIVEAFEPELTLYLANSYPKVAIRGVETGFGYSEKAVGGEDSDGGGFGMTSTGSLTYNDLNSNNPSIEYARAFIDRFKQELKFNSRATDQLHPYTPGGMVADIYYMEERIENLPNNVGKANRAEDVARFRKDPLALLSYIKKRLYDSYGKTIYDRNNEQLQRVLTYSAKLSEGDNAKNINEFMEKVGAFADPAWSIRVAGTKDNYRYLVGVGDSARVHMHRAFNRVGQISALAKNYDTIFAVYKAYFDAKKEELLKVKDPDGNSIWKDYIVPYSVERDEETNRPFTGILPELVEVASKAVRVLGKDTTETKAGEFDTDEPRVGDIPFEDTEIVSLLITDRKSAIDAIGSLKTSIISDIDKSMIKGIVIDIARKNPKIFTDSAAFMTALIGGIERESSIGNRDDIAAFFKSSVSISVEQAKESAPLIKAIKARDDSGDVSTVASLKMLGEALIRNNVPTGYSNMSYLRQKMEYTILSLDEWLSEFAAMDIKFNLEDYPETIKAIVSVGGKTFDQFKQEFDAMSDADKSKFNVPTFGSYVAYYRAYVEAKPIIEAEENYPDFAEFLEMQDDYFENYGQITAKLQEYVSDYKDVSIRLFKEITDLVLLRPKVQKVKQSFQTSLDTLEETIAQNPAASAARGAIDKWKEDMRDAVERHREELKATETKAEEIEGETVDVVPVNDVEEVFEEDAEEISEEDIEELSSGEESPVETDVPLSSTDAPDQFDSVKAIAKKLEAMMSDSAILSWLDQSAQAQKNETLGNMANLADTLSKLSEESFVSIDSLPRFEQAMNDIITKSGENLTLLPQIFSDKYMKRLIEIAQSTLGVDLSEMPLSGAQEAVVTTPSAPSAGEVAPTGKAITRVNLDEFNKALADLLEKVRAVEGDTSNTSESEDLIDQISNNTMSDEQVAAVAANTKAFVEFLSSLKSADFKSQEGVNNLVKQVIAPLSARTNQDFVKLFTQDNFTKLFDIVKSRFGITKTASVATQKITKSTSTHRVASYNISTRDETDEGYYF